MIESIYPFKIGVVFPWRIDRAEKVEVDLGVVHGLHGPQLFHSTVVPIVVGSPYKKNNYK